MKLEPRSGLGGEGSLLNIWEVYCILVSELQGENSEDSNVALASA